MRLNDDGAVGFEEDIVLRGKRYRRQVAVPVPPLPRKLSEGRRWGPSPTSFGLLGRSACTFIALVPLWRLLATGSLWWFLITIAWLPLGVWSVRDTWRRV